MIRTSSLSLSLSFSLSISVLVAVLLLLAAARPAEADEAEALLQEGLVRYKVGKFTEALDVFDRALKTVAPGNAARLHQHRGVVLAILKRTAEAEVAFAAALKLQPTLRLKKGDAKSSIVALFDRIRAAKGGELTVTSSREGAEVSVDGTPRGKAPFTGKVAVGEHQVLVAAGADRFERTIVMPVEGALTVAARLPAAPSPADAASRAPADDASRAPADDASRAPADGGGFRWPVWTSVAGCAALVALGVGIGLRISADAAFEDYQSTTSNSEYWQLRDTIESRDMGATISFAVAGALAATAALLYFLVDRPASARAREASASRPRIAGPGQLVLVW